MNENNGLVSPAPGKPLSVKVIGVGGAGSNMIDQLLRGDLRELACAVAHTSARSLSGSACPEKLLLGARLLRGLGAGGDPDLGKAAAHEDLTPLKAAVEGTDLLFLVAGLGGGTGSGAAPAVARIARESGALVLAIVTLPFEFEGARRRKQAQHALQQLKAAADGVICLPNQKISKLLDENTSMVETFQIANELLIQGVRGVWQMLSLQGLIQVDFADLCSVLRGRHAESCFCTAQGQGDGRGREVVEQLLASPLLNGGQALAEADAVLVSILGGPDLTMAEVNRIMEHLNRQAEHAQVIMGSAVTPEFQGRLKVTLVVSRNGQPEAESSRFADGASSTDVLSEPGTGIDTEFFGATPAARPASRFVAPPPELTPEKAEQLLNKQASLSPRARKAAARLRQGQLPLEIVSKGRFEKSEPTLHRGEDLDVPTYLRRGVALN
jgi:cell division protein FtsZ